MITIEGAQASPYPLGGQIKRFLAAQVGAAFEPTKLTNEDYRRVIDGQVAVFRRYQDDSGRIIDPVLGREFQYATPCYALAAAFLATRDPGDRELLESAALAMDAAIEQMHSYRAADKHGDFFTYPVMRALDLFEGSISKDRMATWKGKLSRINPGRLYHDHLERRYRNPFRGRRPFGRHQECNNWNVVAVCGEYLRAERGLSRDHEFIEKHLAYQIGHFTALGMYRDPACPLAYDHFPRHFLASILHLGYEGPHAGIYRELIQRGAWTSLFMQSPFGEAPVGHRSAQHIWNEAQSAVTYEIYADHSARAGRGAEAGAFKRAAHLSLASIQHWLRPDGTGYVVKNRYPIEARYGYETYSSHSQYNLLASSMLVNAFLFSDDSIAEQACPADVGGFVVPILDDFHKVFANAGGAYMQYDTCGDHLYNPTGLLRVHIRGCNPQLGPSDGRVRADGEGDDLCVGPSWCGADGAWHSLAEYQATPRVEVLEESTNRVRFEVIFEGAFDGVTRIREAFTLEHGSLTVVDDLDGAFEKLRVVFPMLVFDGSEETAVRIDGSSVELALRDGRSRFTVLAPAEVSLQRAGRRLSHKNGEVEAVFAEVEGTRIAYRIDVPAD